MIKHIRKSHRDETLIEQGFTLVELLVVIAILGVLAVVGILSFNGLTTSAKSAVNTTEKSQVQSAYDALLAGGGAAVAVGDDPVAALGTYLKSAPKCTYEMAAGGVVDQTSCPA